MEVIFLLDRCFSFSISESFSNTYMIHYVASNDSPVPKPHAYGSPRAKTVGL